MMYSCIYAHMCLCVCKCMCIHTYVYDVYMNTYVHICLYRLYVCMCNLWMIHLCIYMYRYVCKQSVYMMYVYMYMCVHILLLNWLVHCDAKFHWPLISLVCSDVFAINTAVTDFHLLPLLQLFSSFTVHLPVLLNFYVSFL